MTSSESAQAAEHSSSFDARSTAGTSYDALPSRKPHQIPPRSIPPWIDSYQKNYGPVDPDQLQLLNPPAPSVRPQHNTTPTEPQRRLSRDGFTVWDDPRLGPAQTARARIPHFLRYGRASMNGRKWDHLRSAEPVIIPGYHSGGPQPTTTWHDFVHSSSWGRSRNEDREILTPEAFNKLQPTFNNPVYVPLDSQDGKASRRRRTLAFNKRVWNVVIRHSLSPLLFRLIVMVTSIFALGISARIFHLESRLRRGSEERNQSVVAVAVDTVAIPYIGYMIWDEFTGKPVGLRSGVSKISLILLDLFFIIFKSASTTLAFESLVYHAASNHEIRRLSDALAAFMLIGLISWTMNFAVNIVRTVERLGGGGVGGGGDAEDV